MAASLEAAPHLSLTRAHQAAPPSQPVWASRPTTVLPAGRVSRPQRNTGATRGALWSHPQGRQYSVAEQGSVVCGAKALNSATLQVS